jgi:glycosyltransferase involved in cell wall biosynthesis
MRVFVDGVAFGRQKRGGGVSRVWREYLQRLPGHGIDVALLAPYRSGNVHLQRLRRGVGGLRILPDYFYWPSRWFESVPVRSALLKRHIDDSVDVFQSTYFSTVYGRRCPKVIMIYDMIQEVVAAHPPGKWEKFMMDMKRRAVDNADHVILISQNTRRDLLRFYPHIPNERVSVIYCGSPSAAQQEHISFAEVAGKQNWPISPGQYFLYVGNREGYKNFDILLDLLDHTGAMGDSLFLCVGGEDPRRLRPKLEERGYGRNFLTCGYIEADRLSTLYRNAIALIYPSRYEGFGLPVLEAMANRCPVICSNTSSLPEVGGEAAFYFDPGLASSLADAIERLLRSDRNRVVREGLGNLGRFSWEASTQSLASLYAALM